MRVLLTTLLVLVPLAASVQARTPGDIPEVRNTLVAVAAGDMIRKECTTISPRMLRVFNLRNQLLSTARAAGFSREQIDAYVDDKIEKDRLKGLARQYLAQKGVDPDSPSSYCTVGKAEIAAKTPVGRLLKAK